MSRRRVATLVFVASLLGGVSVTAWSAVAKPTLTVAVTGKGKVVSVPRGISCPKTCRARFPRDARVLLRARPSKGWRFTRWAGPCLGNAECPLKLSTRTAVRAVFTRIPPPPPPSPPPPPVGSLENPVPLGQAAQIGDGWTVTVTQVVPDATQQVLAANQFNDPPPAGYQDFMMAVTATYNGTGSSNLDSGFTFRSVGASKVAYTTFDQPTCGVLPEPDIDLNDPQVFSGGTISGNAACWVVKNSDASSLVMFAHRFLADNEVFFALR